MQIFRTLPPMEALAIAAQTDAALREVFAARARRSAVTYCAGCAMRARGSDDVVVTPAGTFHARCCP